MKQEMYAHIYQLEQTHWWYVARRKIIFEWVLTVLKDRRAPQVLDVGCGTGLNIVHLHKNGYRKTIGLDVSAKALSFCQSRGLTRLVRGDAGKIPLQDGAFDVVMGLDLLEHLDDDRQALAELARVLAPGGALITFAPAFDFLWGLQDEVSHHRRRYRAKNFRRMVQDCGLSIEKLTYVNFFLFPLIWAGRLALRLSGYRIRGVSENDLHPRWSNGLLEAIFSTERTLLKHVDLPFGVSVLCVARKPAPAALG